MFGCSVRRDSDLSQNPLNVRIRGGRRYSQFGATLFPPTRFDFADLLFGFDIRRLISAPKAAGFPQVLLQTYRNLRKNVLRPVPYLFRLKFSVIRKVSVKIHMFGLFLPSFASFSWVLGK